jgi:hypothetical protein
MSLSDSPPAPTVEQQLESIQGSVRPRVLIGVVIASFLVALLITAFLRHKAPIWAPDYDRFIAGKQLQRVLGDGAAEGDVFVLKPLASGTMVAASLSFPPMRASNIATIRIPFSGETPSGGLAFGWQTRDGRQYIVDYASESKTDLLSTRDLKGWQNDIVGISVIARGEMKTPVIVRAVELRGPRLTDTVRLMWQEWTSFEPWDGGSINFIKGGSPQPLSSMTLFLAIGVTLSFVAAFAAQRGWHQRDTRIPTWIWPAVLIGAWLLMDIRWQFNVAHQAYVTQKLFGSKANDEKHRIDSRDLFIFLESARTAILNKTAEDMAATKKAITSPRVFLYSDQEFNRVKGAYFLLPLNVFSHAKETNMDPPEAFAPGDFIVLFRKNGPRYLPVQKVLQYDGQRQVKALLLGTSGGDAVLQVLP